MSRPGGRLRLIASRFCNAQTMERVVDPLIADLQLEHAEAVRAGQQRKAFWIRLVAGVALVKVTILCTGRNLLSLEGWTDDEHRATIRTAVISILSMCAVAIVLLVTQWPFLVAAIRARHAQMLVYLVPSTLPLAIPFGLTIGIFMGFRGSMLSGRSTQIVLAMAVAWSALSCATLVWLLPAANQSYREALAGDSGFAPGTLDKGMNEMTLAELSGQIDSYRGTALAESGFVRAFRFSYHLRLSLACETAVLALFALGVLARWPSAWWMVGLAALGSVAYYVLLFVGRLAALEGAVPSFAGAWLPNVFFVLLSALLLVEKARHSSNRTSYTGC